MKLINISKLCYLNLKVSYVLYNNCSEFVFVRCESIVGTFLSMDLNEAKDSEIESFFRDFVLPKTEGVL